MHVNLVTLHDPLITMQKDICYHADKKSIYMYVKVLNYIIESYSPPSP